MNSFLTSYPILLSYTQSTGTIVFAVVGFLFMMLFLLSSEDSSLKTACIMLAVISFCLAGAYYYIAGKYKADCILSGSGTCSVTCGPGVWSNSFISTSAMFGGSCNTSYQVPCHGATLTCGINACDLGPYDMAPWTSWSQSWYGHKSARWIYSTPKSTGAMADKFKWAFYNASINASSASFAVNIDAVVDDAFDSIKWNSSLINISSFVSANNPNFVHIPNLSFVPSYNIIELDVHNTAGAAGLIFSVTDSNNNPVMLSSSATTMVKLG